MAFTRAASAASSHRAKQELVRVLFGPKYYRQGREAHRMLDHSIYTHSQLKSAYLERLQELHPDKRRNNINNNNKEILPNHNKDDDDTAAREEFISLQEAWDRYEQFAKSLIKVDNGSREANFTLFGVGCSFSDSAEERERRSEITDQACRGWFSAGELGVGGDESSDKESRKTKQPSLLDDDMFVTDEIYAKADSNGKKKSLVDHMVRSRG